MLRPKPPAPEAGARDAARALLSMLETGAPAPGGAPEAQMRLLARDLIAQVEQRRPEVPDAPEAERAPRRTLFSRIAPLAPKPEPPAPAPEPGRAAGAPPDAPVRMPAPIAGITSPPDPQAAAPRPVQTVQSGDALPEILDVSAGRPRRPARLTLLSGAQVRKLALRGMAAEAVEHPAIVALTLQGRPALDQAAALRALPRGQARAVHRALRMLPA